MDCLEELPNFSVGPIPDGVDAHERWPAHAAWRENALALRVWVSLTGAHKDCSYPVVYKHLQSFFEGFTSHDNVQTILLRRFFDELFDFWEIVLFRECEHHHVGELCVVREAIEALRVDSHSQQVEQHGRIFSSIEAEGASFESVQFECSPHIRDAVPELLQQSFVAYGFDGCWNFLRFQPFSFRIGHVPPRFDTPFQLVRSTCALFPIRRLVA
mmetsp:Transcript_2581/g.16779  ORF Transcript_2581/g.16779 Transcript_2581/m.16779 type:complete len:214 (+) Transcript_2581:1592-2233(+)